MDQSQVDFNFLANKPVEVSTRKRTVPGEFVECKADTKRCKVTYNTRKPDQWLTVLKPNKGSSWELTGYGLYSTSEESSEGSNDEDFSDE